MSEPSVRRWSRRSRKINLPDTGRQPGSIGTAGPRRAGIGQASGDPYGQPSAYAFSTSTSQPLGALIREVQVGVDLLRSRVDECDIGIASSEAQLKRMRLEAAEAKRQLQVVERTWRPSTPATLPAVVPRPVAWRWPKTSSAVGSTGAFSGVLQRVQAAAHRDATIGHAGPDASTNLLRRSRTLRRWVPLCDLRPVPALRTLDDVAAVLLEKGKGNHVFEVRRGLVQVRQHNTRVANAARHGCLAHLAAHRAYWVAALASWDA